MLSPVMTVFCGRHWDDNPDLFTLYQEGKGWEVARGEKMYLQLDRSIIIHIIQTAIEEIINMITVRQLTADSNDR